MQVLSKWSNMDAAGLLPCIFDEEAPVTAREQIEVNYAHGGGFRSMLGDGDWQFNHNAAIGESTLKYPGDPIFREQSRCYLPVTQETLILFSAGLVVIVAADGSYDITRMD